jgi:hypothetical protein
MSMTRSVAVACWISSVVTPYGLPEGVGIVRGGSGIARREMPRLPGAAVGEQAENIFDHLVDFLLVVHPRPPIMDGRG